MGPRQVGQAVSALAHAPNFETGLRAVVEAGGDAATNGAVAGGLLGARFGAQALPRRWVRPLRAAAACRSAAYELLARG
jgi:ADP-ribosylglycohydrolase